VQLVVSDAHAGLKKAIAQVLGCPWQRCSVHFLREALGHARREQQPILAALLRPLFWNRGLAGRSCLCTPAPRRKLFDSMIYFNRSFATSERDWRGQSGDNVEMRPQHATSAVSRR
jgi:hypothetical protein